MSREGMRLGQNGHQLRASAGVGLKPDRHIAGFSIRKEDGTQLPLIFEAAVGQVSRHRRPQADRSGSREVVPLVRLRHGPLLQPDRRR